MSNDMFRKDELGGSVGVVDEPKEFRGTNEDLAVERAYLSSEHDKPWNPVEEATEGEIDELIGSLKETEGEMEKYVKMYQHGIEEMGKILIEFRNSPDKSKGDVFLLLTKAKDYINRFNLELQKKGSEYQNEFLAKVDFFLSKDGINRESLMVEVQETVKKYAEEVRRENEARRLKESAAQEVGKKPETESKGFFRGFFR